MKKRTRLNLQRLESLARWLELPLSTLEHVATHAADYYKPKEIAKRTGGVRRIDRPVGLLKDIQRAITTKVLRQLEISSVATGGVPGISHIDTVRVHTNKPCIANLDIAAFFPSTTNRHVYAMWNRLGCAPDVARLLTMLTTFEGHLPQGSPASTDIVNVMLVEFDEQLLEIARRRAIDVSRYIDDITVSGDHGGVREILNEAIRGLHRLGFKIQRRKLTVASSGHAQTVLGLRVNRVVGVPLAYRRSARAAIGVARQAGITAEDHRKLVGRIRYIGLLHRKEADKMAEMLNGVVILPEE